MMPVRRYLGFAILTAIIVLGVGLLFGSRIASFLQIIETNTGGGVIAQLVIEPLIWVMENPVIGAVAAGLLWPLLLLWIGFLFIVIVVGFGSSGAQFLEQSV
ncbi:MAG: hypothetical protein MUF87_10825 [Anaerolineae bacterium]|nr:hypothetical protein [Anaerolineae bacterium]